MNDFDEAKLISENAFRIIMETVISRYTAEK